MATMDGRRNIYALAVHWPMMLTIQDHLNLQFTQQQTRESTIDNQINQLINRGSRGSTIVYMGSYSCPRENMKSCASACHFNRCHTSNTILIYSMTLKSLGIVVRSSFESIEHDYHVGTVILWSTLIRPINDD